MESPTTENLIMGYELCRACGWKNLFWADEDPRPMLISSLKMAGFVCLECRADQSGQRMHFAPFPASELFTGEEILFELEKDRRAMQLSDEAQTGEVLLGLRRQLRAVVRWWSPWEGEVRELCMALTMVFALIALAGLLLGNAALAMAVANIFWLLAKLFLVWRLCLTALVLLMMFGKPRHFARNFQKFWREFAFEQDEPLFGGCRRELATRRYSRESARWLRSQGLHRQEASKVARTSASLRQWD